MQIKIGEKIKELRARDGRTQSDLAAAVGVSCQAVSRWEANGGYPDIEIIPAIANYFHVTVDELYGYHGDREERIKEILNKARDMLSNERYIRQKGSMSEKVGECVQMLRAAAEEFPCEPEILLQLGGRSINGDGTNTEQNGMERITAKTESTTRKISTGKRRFKRMKNF